MKKPKYKMLFNAALAKIHSLLNIDAGIEEWSQEEREEIKRAVIKFFNDLDANLELKDLPELPSEKMEIVPYDGEV